ncbi:MAG: hypothetical protein AAGC55_21930, partial [Myxococcota bacterium]
TAATTETQQDFGEFDIFPDAPADGELLEATQELRNPPAPQGSDGATIALPAEAMAAVDAEATPILAERIGPEQQKYAEGHAQFEADSLAAHEQAQQEMGELEQATRTEQEEAQTTAQADVTAARQEWQGEIESIQSDFQSKANEARGDHQQRITAKQTEGNERATQHIADAERQAVAEKQQAERAAADKKREAESESQGFWGWVKSKAKALIDGLKAAVNFIYDNLRKAVKALFEAAKRLAVAAVDLARQAIVGLIKAYGELLKTFVNIALAAFPELRDRIKRRIDVGVARATELVNQAAEALKSGITAIIDFLASTIDKVLGIIQDLYNGILTVIAMIVSGELKELLERLGKLIEAAGTAPGQFETAAYEELLGGDLDQPLSPAELMAAGRTPPGGAAPGMEGAESDAMPSPPWTENNVGVEQVASGESLSPELTAQILEQTGGGDGTVTFGQSQDPSRSLESILGMDGQQSGQTGADGQQAAYTDGLTPRERAAIKWEAMKQGLSQWWSNNWPLILAGGVLGVAGFIVANILTGGAILAALPAVMTAIGYIFTGVMVAQIAGHVRDYLQKGWNGDIQGGGKSLAKGMAAGAIELISL